MYALRLNERGARLGWVTGHDARTSPGEKSLGSLRQHESSGHVAGKSLQRRGHSVDQVRSKLLTMSKK